MCAPSVQTTLADAVRRCAKCRRPGSAGKLQPPERGTALSDGVPPGGAAPAGGPTVLRMLLGAQLRRLRESSSVTRDDAGYHIRASGSKISRMELGRVSFKER